MDFLNQSSQLSENMVRVFILNLYETIFDSVISSSLKQYFTIKLHTHTKASHAVVEFTYIVFMGNTVRDRFCCDKSKIEYSGDMEMCFLKMFTLKIMNNRLQ